MTGLVVVVTRDIPLGRTCVSWYADDEDWEFGYPVATIDPTSLWIDRQAADKVARQASNLFMNELRVDARADLSWLATHRVVASLLEPIPGRSAA
jgi:hypothetical protein